MDVMYVDEIKSEDRIKSDDLNAIHFFLHNSEIQNLISMFSIGNKEAKQSDVEIHFNQVDGSFNDHSVWFSEQKQIELQVTAPLLFNDIFAESKFINLKDTWKRETSMMSSLSQMFSHPAYLNIISMGNKALPYIFKELESEPDDWFWALTSITGDDPTRTEDEGNIQKMTDHWLDWARVRLYI